VSSSLIGIHWQFELKRNFGMTGKLEPGSRQIRLNRLFLSNGAFAGGLLLSELAPAE
jgi:hypothetical protein